MKAIVQERFGPPEVLRPAEIDRPTVGAGQVLVRVRAAALNPYDWHMLRGDPYVARLIGGVGLTRPRQRVAGIDAAGQVEAVGAGVQGLRPGDEVLGFCPGAFAEYARTTPDLLVPKPPGLTFAQAAAVPMGAVTALRGIRTVGRVRAGQRVCSAGNAGLVRSLGAAHVVDHAREDFTERHGRYDVILDNVGNHPPTRLRRALTPTGTLVANGGGSPGRVFGAVGSLLRTAALDTVVRQRLRPILPSAPSGPTHEDLLAVTALVDSGRLTPVVDRTYALADTAEGLRHVERGHARGKAVITVP